MNELQMTTLPITNQNDNEIHMELINDCMNNFNCAYVQMCMEIT